MPYPLRAALTSLMKAEITPSGPKGEMPSCTKRIGDGVVFLRNERALLYVLDRPTLRASKTS